MKKQIFIFSIFVLLTSFATSQNEWLAYDVFSTTPDNDLTTNYIKKIYIDETDCYWILSYYYGITKYNEGELTALTADNHLASNKPQNVFEDSFGNIWISYTDNQGVTMYDGTSYHHFHEGNYLSSNNFRNFFEDSDQRIWIWNNFNDECGINVYDEGSWIFYNSSNGLESNSIETINRDVNGNVYVTYEYDTDAGFSYFDGNTWSTINTGNGLISNQVNDIFPASNGDVWILFSSNSGVAKFENGVIINYSTYDGLLTNRVLGIHEDMSGQMWFKCFSTEPSGSMEGISMFDGTSFSNYTTDNGLAASFVTDFFNDSNGNLWINYYPQYNGGWGNYGEPVGITKYDGTEFTTYTVNDGLASDLISRVYEDNDNNIWFNHNSTYSQAFYTGNPYGASKWNGNEFMVYDTLSGLLSNYVRSLSCQSNGDIWFEYGSKMGLSLLDEQILSHFSINDGLSSNGWYSFKEDHQDRAVFTSSNGLSVYDGTWGRVVKSEGLLDNYATAVAEDDLGQLYFTSEYGVNTYNGVNWKPVTICEGLAINQTSGIFKTSNYGMWFNHPYTWDAGIAQFDGTNWIAYNTGNHLSSDIVKEVFEDSSGRLWIRYSGHFGITQFDGQNWITYTIADGLHSDALSGIVEDMQGNIWVYSNSGASRFDGNSWESFNSSNGLAYDLVQEIFVSSNNELWFTYPFWCDELCSFPWQITKYDGSTWQSFLPDESWNIYDYGVKEDQSGDLWIAALGGVIYHDGVSWDLITSEDGLIDNGCRQVFIQSDNTKWFLTGSGITRFDGTFWESFTEDDMLVNNYVTQVLEDSKGNLWFKYNNYSTMDEYYGISKFDEISWTHYDESVGLISNSVKELYEDGSGYIWAITDKGLGKYSGNVGIVNQSDQHNSLMNIYPNPMQDNGKIIFYLQEKSHVSITFYDNQGKLVYELNEEVIESGKQIRRFSLENQSSGLYYCMLKVNGEILDSQKVIKQ